MSKTARMVMKIIGASLAFAAFVCLLIGGWHDLSVGCCGVKKRLSQKFGSEYDDYADEELYDGGSETKEGLIPRDEAAFLS